MPATDVFLELEYGKLYSLDLHGLILDEAKANVIHVLSTIDNSYKGLIIIHGYHKGRVLREYFRNKFEHCMINKKIVLDASRTIFLFN